MSSQLAYVTNTVLEFFISFPTWYTFILFFYIYSFSLHVSDRLVHHQENQMFNYTCSLWHRSLSRWCVVRGRWSNTNGHARHVEKNCKCKKKKENKSASSWKRNKEFINDARSAKYKDCTWIIVHCTGDQVNNFYIVSMAGLFGKHLYSIQQVFWRLPFRSEPMWPADAYNFPSSSSNIYKRSPFLYERD